MGEWDVTSEKTIGARDEWNVAKETPLSGNSSPSLITKLGKRWENIKTEFMNHPSGNYLGVPSPIHIGGQLAGSVNDITGSAISGLYGFLPQSTRDYIKGFEGEAFADKTPIGGALAGAAKGVGKLYGQLKEASPETVKYAEDVGNIATAIPIIKGVTSLAGGVIDIVKNNLGAQAIAAKLAKAPIAEKEALISGWNDKIDKIVDSGLQYGLGKRSVTNYTGGIAQKAKDSKAITTLVENKEAIGLTDDAGNIILPQTREQMKEAVHNGKTAIWQKYEEGIKKAGLSGTQINGDVVADALDNIAINKTILRTAPDKAKYAKDLADKYRGVRLSPIEAQQDIASFNDSLHSFFKTSNVDKSTLASAYVDAKASETLKNAVDDVFEKISMAGQKELRSQYSSLRSIEQDVNKAANKMLAKNSGITAVDYLSGSEILYGIINHNPGAIVAGVFTKGLKTYKNYMVNPDRNLENMFNHVDKIVSRRNALQKTIPISSSPEAPVKPVNPQKQIPLVQSPLEMGMADDSLPKRAEGGTVEKDKPYIVGEKGAEVFIPEKTGVIIPNEKLNIPKADSIVKAKESEVNMFPENLDNVLVMVTGIRGKTGKKFKYTITAKEALEDPVYQSQRKDILNQIKQYMAKNENI